MLHFYPRSPCGERPAMVETLAIPSSFLSTLSLRRATAFRQALADVLVFLSTLSLRRATLQPRPLHFCAGISIHALLAESDLFHKPPRHPARRFLSTLSLRRATRLPCESSFLNKISIHALLAESDSASSAWWIAHRHFYPRSPCGERHILCVVSVQIGGFLSTLSLRRATSIRHIS